MSAHGVNRSAKATGRPEDGPYSGRSERTTRATSEVNQAGGGGSSPAGIGLLARVRARHKTHGFHYFSMSPPDASLRHDAPPCASARVDAVSAGGREAEAMRCPLSPREVEAIAMTLNRMEHVPIEDARRRVLASIEAGARHLDVTAADEPSRVELRGERP